MLKKSIKNQKLSSITNTMSSDEFVSIQELLNFSNLQMQEEIGKGRSSVQGYRSGKLPIPDSVAIILRQKLKEKDLPEPKKESIAMDVSNLDKLTIEEMVNFCFEHEEHFKNTPPMRLLLKVVKLEGIVEGKEHQIFQNLGKKE